MDIESIKYDFSNLFLKLVTLNMQPELSYRDTHLHKAIEIIFVTSGSVACRIQDTEITLNSNDTVLINPLFAHRIRPLTPASITYMQIDISKYDLRETYPVSLCFNEFVSHQFTESHFLIQEHTELFRVLQNLKEEAIGQQKGFQLYIKGYIFEIAAYIHRHFLSPKTISEKYLPDISAMVTYIEENYHSKIYLEDIAKAAGLEKYSICKTFKKATGQTLVDYINFVRLQKARALLTAGDSNIAQVAFSCGFSSVQYFNRVFKNYYACTPSVYIRSN